MILFWRLGRESKNELSPPYSLSIHPSFLITHSITACVLLSMGIHRVDVEKIVIAMFGLLLLHHRLRVKPYRSQLSVLMQRIHLSDNLLFFSKLVPLYRISSLQIFSDNGDILREKFQRMQWLPGLILEERTLWARSQDGISIFIPVSIFMLNGDNEIFLILICFIKRSQDYHSFHFQGNWVKRTKSMKRMRVQYPEF